MKRKVAIEDMTRIRALGNLTLSPSGKKAAFTVKTGALEENAYKTDIWVYDEAHSPALYRLTAGEDGSAPIFLDDDTILFSSDRKKKHQKDVFGAKTTYQRISLSGGEAEEAFFLPFPVIQLASLGEDKWLAVGKKKLTLPDPEGLDEAEKAKLKKELEEEKDYEVFDELPFWFDTMGIINKVRNGLYLCDTAKKTQELLTDPYFNTGGFALNAEKTQAVYWGVIYESLRTKNSRLYLRDLSDGSVREFMLPEHLYITKARFVDGKIILLGTRGEKLGSTQNDEVWEALPDLSVRMVCAPDATFSVVGSDIAGRDSSFDAPEAFYFTQVEGYRSYYKKMTADGTFSLLADDVNIISAAVGREDDMYLIGMEKDRPQELYRKKDGELKKLSSFNEKYVEEHEIARTEHFTFCDREGTEIDGFVLYPADFDKKKTYPAILTVHGGPCMAYGEGFFHEFQYWAGLGYIVFFCNPPGSSGKGDAFADILGDKFGVRDYNAIMDFTDEVLKRVPQIDPARVAMTGGSYAGFMANWVIGHTDRFAAVVSCRGISNYLSKMLTTDVGYYHNLSQLGCDPWSDPRKLWEHSPLAYADKVKTPTLFIQSDEDYRCWMGDAVQMLQALIMHGVPTRMCLFHGENHELSRSGKPKHRVRRLREMTQWFDKYLNRQDPESV